MKRIIIIGAGPGGYETAVAAAKKGHEVVIISDGPVGGTCLNEGCIPTKALCRNAEVMETLSRASVFGVDIPSYSCDFSKVQSRKEEVVAQLRSGVEFLLRNKNITLVYGKASFKDSHCVKVSSEDPDVDGKEYEGDAVIIACGSYSATLPIPGNDLPGVISSREILKLEEVPGTLCVIGAGVIGLEFASIFKSFGSDVKVVEFCKDILPRFDTDLAKRLKQALSKRGIEIETSAGVQSIEQTADGKLKVSYSKKDKLNEIVADKVLMAVGRRPAVKAVNLDDIGVEYTPKGVVVDANMRTNVPGVYAIGDICGGMMLAHVATFQGYRALADIDGEDCNIDLSVVPAAVFTYPEAAVVGLSEDDCKNAQISAKCAKSMFRANGKALSMDEPEGFCKLVYYSGEPDGKYVDGQILGCHLFGAHAADLVQEIAALITRKATVSQFKDIIHAHPTLGEVVMNAAHSI